MHPLSYPVPTLASLVIALAPLDGHAIGFSGFTKSIAGTNGNPVIGSPNVPITGPGSFATGPIVGPNGNTSRSSVVVTLAGPLPSLTLFGTGNDPAGSTGTNGFAIAGLSYSFTVVGPAVPGLLVPVIFAGATSGTITQSGDPSQFASFTGTSLDIVALGLNNNLRDAGTTGTLPTVSPLGQLNANGARLGWGSSAAAPVSYLDFASSFAVESMLLPGTIGTISMNARLQGGVAGLVRPTGIPASGTANAFLDPLISIDPDFAAVHPGYSIVVEDGIGNGPASVPQVPEPATWASMLAGVAALLTWRRGAAWRRSTGRIYEP